MSLPTYQTSERVLTLVQSNWSSLLNPLLDNPLNQGQILEQVTLQIGSNVVNHKLGRKLRGWFIVRQRSAGDVYDTQDTNPSPQTTLTLTSSAIVSVDIFVF